MTSDEIISIYNAESLMNIEDNCLIININKNYKRGAGVEAIYNATKETLKMAEWRPQKYCYVLSEYQGLIREVFKIKEWYTKKRPDKHGKIYLGYGFNGEVADAETRNKYINKTIQGIKPQGYGYTTVYPETLMGWINNIEN